MSKKKREPAREIHPDEYMAAQTELDELREKYGYAPKEGAVSRVITRFLNWRAARVKVAVDKKKYMLLMILGAFGAHRFYARQYISAVFYLLTCWTGFSIAMTIVDVLAVVPMQPDENGKILL